MTGLQSRGSLSGAVSPLLGLQLLRLRRRLFDRPDIHERIIRQLVPLAVAQLLEAAQRVFLLGVVAGEAGELLGHEERLAEEALDLAGPRDGALVLFAELFLAQNRDDVLQRYI